MPLTDSAVVWRCCLAAVKCRQLWADSTYNAIHMHSCT